MKTTNKNRKSKFLALLLSAMMLSSAGAAFAACQDDADSSSSSSSSSSETSDTVDEGLVKNANFNTFNKNGGKNVIGTSVTGWTRSVNSVSTGTALSSKAASGIIDTDTSDDAEYAWEYLTGRTKTDEELKALTDEQAEDAWDTFTAGDKLAYYDIWKDRDENDDKKIASDFAAYQALNIDAEDIPKVNPETHSNAPDTKVLMIHNDYSTTSSSKTLGTAQKYTSSSTVTVKAGTSAEFSVWVKTAELQSAGTDGTVQATVDKGAYISITHSVGGKSLDAYEVKNIDTENMDASALDNGWKQYTFYLQGSSYADTTFSIVLGLGQGGGTDRLNYVNGYAFFDDIQCNIISNDDYATKAEGLTAVGLEDDKVKKTVNVYEVPSADKFALNFHGQVWSSVSDKIEESLPEDPKPTESSDGAKTNDKLVSPTKDVVKFYDGFAAIEEEATNNQYLKTIYDNFFTAKNLDDADGTLFAKDEKVLMMLSTKGAAYTAEPTYKFTMDEQTDYMALSFYVKTSDLSGATGAGITLVDGLNKTSFTSLNTYGLTGVTVGEDEDAYDGWQKVYFFVTKDEDLQGKEASFTLVFNYGPTDVTVSTSKDSFLAGFAAFTGFEAYNMTELEYESAQSGTYAKKVTLVTDTSDKATGNAGFDTAAGVPSNALEVGLANLQNYKGVYNDSYYVSLPSESDTATDKENKHLINQYANAGLLNKEYFADILEANLGKEDCPAWLTGIANGETDADVIWNNVFGNGKDDTATATQPLLIWNEGLAGKTYGFIGASTSVSDEYTAISVRVKTSVGAKASVYLIDMDDTTRQTTLSIGRKLTYWYDDDGNICTADPSKNSTQIALKLQSNGLYMVNKNWDKYDEALHGGKYYANLSAYVTKNSEGDLIAAEDGATHDYYDYTWNREVFYAHEGNYYTEDNGAGVLVNDLSTIADLTPRYAAEANRELKFENIDTNGEWATVTFYIHKGAEAKNYRLEVWSGTRNGQTVNTSGYVIFDTNNPGTASDNFDALIEEYIDQGVTNADDVPSEQSYYPSNHYFKSVFSYYDTDKHVRYDAALDTDESGNAYENSFTASSYTEGVAYLKYESGNVYNVFADYSLSEVTITASADTDDSTNEDSSSDDDSDVNIAMLISSISVSAILLIAVAIIVIRKVIENVRKKKGIYANTTKKNNK